MSRFIFVVVLVLVVVFGLAFAVENAHQVNFKFFSFGETEKPLSLLLVIAVLFGGLLGVVASWTVVLRLKTQIRSLRKSEAMAKEEVRNLRTIPLKDTP